MAERLPEGPAPIDEPSDFDFDDFAYERKYDQAFQNSYQINKDLGRTPAEESGPTRRAKSTKKSVSVRGSRQLLVKDTPPQAHAEAMERIKQGSGRPTEEEAQLGLEQAKRILDKLGRKE